MEKDSPSTDEREPGHDLHLEHEDSTIRFLHRIIRVAVKILAVLMVLVIVWGIGDVIYVLYQRLSQPPFLLLQINDILATFGAFLAVLIAIEIFINISMYLSTNVIPVRLVIATALMAISRKVIIFDYDKITPPFIYGTAAGPVTPINNGDMISFSAMMPMQNFHSKSLGRDFALLFIANCYWKICWELKQFR